MLEAFVHRFTEQRPRGYEARMWFLGDIHAGSRHVRVDRLDADIAAIRDDPDAWWFGMGDYGDWVAFGDKRFEYYECADWLDISDPWASTLDWIEAKLKPIADKCLGMIRGNHEVTALQRSQFHVYKHLCARLGVLQLGDLAMYRIIWTRTVSSRDGVDVLLTHGWGGGRTAGARTGKIEQLMRDNLANVYALGHMHGVQPVVRADMRTMSTKNRMLRYPRIGVTTGTYLEDAEYERRAGFGLSVIGAPVIRIQPFERLMTVGVR